MIADTFEIEIALKLLSSSNCTPPNDLQLVAKVITGNNVIVESKPSAMSTGSENSWTLEVKFELWVNHFMDRILVLRIISSSPADCASLTIEITCTSHAQKKAFWLESVQLNTSDIVNKADNKQRTRLHRYSSESAQLISQVFLYVWM
jgi:hypothetical protein